MYFYYLTKTLVFQSYQTTSHYLPASRLTPRLSIAQ